MIDRTRDIRLAACDLIKRRFAGRAELRRRAAYDAIALARLELALGLGTEEDVAAAQFDQATRELQRIVDYGRFEAVARRALAQRLLAAAGPAERRANAFAAEKNEKLDLLLVVLGEAEHARIWDLRKSRRAARNNMGPRTGDPLARRKPHHMLRRYAAMIAERLISKADFRTATHSHEVEIAIVEPGREGASSSTAQARPSDVGLPNAYAKQGFFVTTSTHSYSISIDAILDPVVRQATTRGHLYLRPDLRVVQGRGTSLVVERLAPTARAGGSSGRAR
jgi:hypothetical protein